MKKKYAIIITIFILVVGGISFFQSQVSDQKLIEKDYSKEQTSRDFDPEENLDQKKNNISLKIDFGNGRIIEGEGNAKNVLEFLVQIAKSNNIEVRTKEYKYGAMVESIDGLDNSTDSFWGYSVNGKPGQIASDRYLLELGDQVEWKFNKAD